MRTEEASTIMPGSIVRVPCLWEGEFEVTEVIYRRRGDVRIYNGNLDISQRSHYDIGIHVNGEYMLVDCKYVKKA